MAKDIIYTFNKTTFVGSIFGEIQSNFNMSLTIDGTKDSMKVNVWSFYEDEILPYTIVYHQKTQTWWVATHDKVERYSNEDGFIYLHNLQLLGAIELLNARDLTDCGFNSNTYTIEEFIIRLVKLSTFEFKGTTFFDLNIDLDDSIGSKYVEYIKTFENYTLLSAMREFLDGYNMCAKLSFYANFSSQSPRITGATIKVIQRTGDFNLATHNIDEFDDVRESKTISKDNYGTCVVSNAENVISSVSKTYPSLGTIRPSGTQYNILAQNAVIRLPSNVFKANWLKLCLSIPPLSVRIKIGSYEGVVTNQDFSITGFSVNPYNIKTFGDSFSRLNSTINTICTEQGQSSFYTGYSNAFFDKQEEIIDYFKRAATITLYNGNELNPVDGSIVKGANVPYIPNVTYNAKWIGDRHPTLPLIFCDKEMRDTLERPWQGIYWERGKNTISGFNAFETEPSMTGSITSWDVDNCDLQGQTTFMIYQSGSNYVRVEVNGGGETLHFRDSQWIVNYIPMADLKLKVDNERENNDAQLYNQNGRLTDCVALSKVINSYSKEISSDTITRYKAYYSFSVIPSVGSVVKKGNDNYVINNISFDFSQNENDTYFIECEITMSKYISLKSMMVNPNTNIRDYGIPQNYNVKRKQLYRDYYELDYDVAGDNDVLMNPYDIFDFYNTQPVEYTAVMRLHYSRYINNSINYYYQLDTVNYYMNKLLVIVCDFNDNNIIGYTNQNVWSGFDISRVFSGQIDSLNTPISYTDGAGEVKDFYICFEDNDRLTTIYYNYQISQTGGDTYKGNLYNYSPFIPQAIYDSAYSSHNMLIEETNYNKDALEVPVFEYSCQIGDTHNVIVGDNFFTKHPNEIVMYSFYTGNDLDQYNVTTPRRIYRINEFLNLTNAVVLMHEPPLPSPAIDYRHIDVIFYENYRYDIENASNRFGAQLSVPSNGQDIAIFRHTYNLDTDVETKELVFIAKKVTTSVLTNNKLLIAINHFKVK